ncbi:AAA family ATPase (plasmid) [Agrobacterium sp. rho-8.1]|nr:ATP-binding protein [Agrobacterium sp. rho-8.1]
MSARIDTVVDIETLRSPILSLPGDIDAAWFRDWVPISNRQIRLFHAKWGKTILPVTGFPWPPERPGVDAVYDLLPEAARYPYFLRLFLQEIEPGASEKRTYFKRLSSRYVDALRASGVSTLAPKDAEATRQQLVELAARGRGEISTAVVLLEWSAQPIPDKPLSMFNVADSLPELRSYILAYMACSSDPFETLLASDPLPIAGHASVEEEEPVADHAGPHMGGDLVQTSWNDAITTMAYLLTTARNVPPDASLVGALEKQLGILEKAAKQHALDLAPRTTEDIAHRAAALLSKIKGALIELELLDDALSLLCDSIATRIKTLPSAALLGPLDEAANILAAAEANGTIVAEDLASYRSPPKMPPKQFITFAHSLLDAIETNARTALEGCDDALVALAVTTMPNVVNDPISVECVEDYTTAMEPGSAPLAPEAEDIAALSDNSFFDDEEPFEIPLPPVIETEAADDPDAAPIDPFVADIHAKAAELFTHHEWGLAYHFARASEPMLSPGETPITSDELKVIAFAKEMTGSKYEPEGFKDALEACVVIAEKIAQSSTPLDRARQTALYAAMVPTALFNLSESSKAFSIIEHLNGSGHCAAFFRLKEVLDENRKSNFPLSLQNIAAAGDAKADRSYLDECQKRILAKIAAFQASNFRFALGQKIKKELLSNQGEVTLLASAMQSPTAVDAANRFSEEFPDRQRVLLALEKIAEAVGHGQVIDGAARERLVALLLDLSSLCQDLRDAKRQATDLQARASRRTLVRRLIDDLAASIDHFTSHLEDDDSDRLLVAANGYARDVLGRLSAILRGSTASEFDRTAANLALHVPLLWLPNMTWSHAWTPSPADSPKLVNAIIDLPLPRLNGTADECFRIVVEQRYQEDAFLAAKALLQFWQHFGLGEVEYLDLEARVATTESLRRGQLAAQQETVGMLLHKVRRMALGGLKVTADLEESLRTVTAARSGDDIAWDFMPEEIDGVRITDVNAAFERLSDLERQARKLLDEGKAALEGQITSLSATEVSDGERQALSKLLEADDLATLSDWLGMFASGATRRPVLETGAANKDLVRFRSILRQIKGADLVQLGQMLTTGSDNDIYGIAALDEDQREEAGEVLKTWQIFKRAIKSGLGGPQLIATLLGLVSQLSFDCSLVEMNKSKTKKGSLLVIDAVVSMSFDGQSSILPDFGSMVDNSWQIAAATNTVSNSEIISLPEGAENRGTLLLFFGSMATERREQLKLDCIRMRRKILVVDEVMLATVLTMPERRRLAMFELAQASTVAKPYQDYGRSQVPPEMFKGRAKELAGIVDPFGSYIVYGGRRLGKTALLRHLERRAPPHAEFGYVDLMDASSKSLWEKAARVLVPIFGEKRVATADDFEQGIKDFLSGDGRRRVLLMLDEADNFVRQEAQETDHRHVLRLIALMNETNHRFKFTLSGLHNVSRITKAENSPLAQISSDPVRIGPLVNGDAGDAEALVRLPLAALGYEFANREDVWRILSFANYYPILIQVFCQGLLDNIEEHQKSTNKLIWSIPSTMVDRALADPRIRKTLYESFEKTIKHIEQRYELLTYIIAERALIDVEGGNDGDGMTTSEVAERATKYWPEAFPKGSDPAETDYLLDEMEGFGILRRITGTNKWGLRSRMLLDLMVTDEEDLLTRIYSFQGRKPEDHFDPKNARSILPLSGRSDHELRISPLTDGQEATLLDPDVNPATAVVIFGPAIANADQVYLALKRSSNPKVTVEVRGWRDCGDLLSEIKRVRQDDHLLVLIVPHTTEWTPDWVRNVAKQANVVRGRVRPVFVGTSHHAAVWSGAYPWGSKVPHRIEITTLKPWSRSYIAARLDAINGLKPKTIDRIVEVTGGWNDPCQAVFASAASGAAVDKMLQELSTQQSGDISERFGMPPEFFAIFSTLADYCEGETADSILSLFEDRELASTAIRFGLLMGILTTTAADPNSGASERFSMNGVAKTLIVGKR